MAKKHSQFKKSSVKFEKNVSEALKVLKKYCPIEYNYNYHEKYIRGYFRVKVWMHYSYGPKRLAQKKQILLTVQNDIVCGPLHSKSTINIYKGHSHVIYLRTFNKITHHHSLDYFGLTER